MLHRAIGYAVFAVALSGSMAPALAANVSFWNVGTGQLNGNFTVGAGSLNGDAIELGLRATNRQGAYVTPDGDVYTIESGTQPGKPAYGRWNFDIHVDYDGLLEDLSGLQLQIERGNGNIVAFDLLGPLRNFIDCHVLNCATAAAPVPGPGSKAPPGGHVGSSDSFFQASQNAAFSPWLDADGYNPWVAETLIFTLTATFGQEPSISTSMVVDVVPEPAALGLLGLGLVGLVAARRRKA